ncbi:hypothetical protein CVT24_010160 [Panaeolus cyanescens]|uniref:F-box domain-containing protein n=1 Tax=Panaeolus cyanescens TaxID=181874 RepID=A0A409YW37_9AGAR|nr:hypothetical protein CVT24_010160 [Panaeolus cyanescens]
MPTSSPCPLDIIEHILEYVAERRFEEDLDQPRLETLRSCALVCKDLSTICRRFLVQRISGTFPYSSSGRSRLLQSQNMMAKYPTLLGRVRELCIKINARDEMVLNRRERRSNRTQLQSMDSYLTKFNNLRFRKITHDADFHTSDFSLGLITTYTAQSSLRYLTLEGAMKSQIWHSIIASPCLDVLTIRDAILPPCDVGGMNGSIRRIHFTGVSLMIFPMHMFSRFSMLEVLELRSVSVSGIKDETPWVPSARLREITVTLAPGIQQSIRITQHLQSVEALTFAVSEEEDFEILSSLLNNCPFLKHLDLTLTSSFVAHPSRPVQRLHTVLGPFSSLTMLQILYTHTWQLDDRFSNAISDIASLFDTMKNFPNVVQKVSIYTSFTSETPHWRNLCAARTDLPSWSPLNPANIFSVIPRPLPPDKLRIPASSSASPINPSLLATSMLAAPPSRDSRSMSHVQNPSDMLLENSGPSILTISCFRAPPLCA